MKKILGIVALGLLWCSNVNALPSWIGDKPIKICKASQDVKVSMNWYKDNGKLDGDPVYTSIKKGDYLGYLKRVKGSDKNKKERYWVKSNGGHWKYFFPTDSHILGMGKMCDVLHDVELLNFDKNFDNNREQS